MYDLLWKKEQPLFRTFLLEFFQIVISAILKKNENKQKAP